MTITIKDLPQSEALDRKAMRAIVGGARFSGRPNPAHPATRAAGPVAPYPPGFAGRVPVQTPRK